VTGSIISLLCGVAIAGICVHAETFERVLGPAIKDGHRRFGTRGWNLRPYSEAQALSAMRMFLLAAAALFITVGVVGLVVLLFSAYVRALRRVTDVEIASAAWVGSAEPTLVLHLLRMRNRCSTSRFSEIGRGVSGGLRSV